MSKSLLFYEKEDYYDYKLSKNLDGFSIISISKLINNIDSININDYENEIIDISVITEYKNIQSITEQLLDQIPDTQLFICDVSKKETVEYELRFIFETFENIDKTSYEKLNSSKNKDPNNNTPLKLHKKVTDLHDDQLTQFFIDFNKNLYGHSKFKDDFEEQVRIFQVFNKLGENKILSLFLMGESGVGKTEVARTIFNCLKGEKKFAKINFGNYSSEFSLSSLIGASRGYRDSEDGEIFMKVRDSDVGVLLIDEFEKSNATLFNYFLNVLETGILESSLGEQIDLNGFIIIFTSNITKEDFKKRISPELRSRFDYKCIFTLLSDEEKRKYIEFRANSIGKKVLSEYEVDLTDQIKKHLVNEIKVSNFKNMRDINKKIKKEFIRYLGNNISIRKNTNIGEKAPLGFPDKILNFFKS
ncbi:ATP-dependent Clp protease ATP-binding subunit [Litoribacter alkaliphilus]|uniref:ATP-dependent Clp protease ATP-binding subunit n=1 Tax=Litoribacter ruber TaxID=702568 RepID=A0AAP2G6D1_9BACT|nr:AAA family ATPase [Litoribacter alkaliphilus]MBS9525936.1 ATP-dependent Clp protease ATP-binding subunit [Litoribacter alkaliphilus]